MSALRSPSPILFRSDSETSSVIGTMVTDTGPLPPPINRAESIAAVSMLNKSQEENELFKQYFEDILSIKKGDIGSRGCDLTSQDDRIYKVISRVLEEIRPLPVNKLLQLVNEVESDYNKYSLIDEYCALNRSIITSADIIIQLMNAIAEVEGLKNNIACDYLGEADIALSAGDLIKMMTAVNRRDYQKNIFNAGVECLERLDSSVVNALMLGFPSLQDYINKECTVIIGQRLSDTKEIVDYINHLPESMKFDCGVVYQIIHPHARDQNMDQVIQITDSIWSGVPSMKSDLYYMILKHKLNRTNVDENVLSQMLVSIGHQQEREDFVYEIVSLDWIKTLTILASINGLIGKQCKLLNRVFASKTIGECVNEHFAFEQLAQSEEDKKKLLSLPVINLLSLCLITDQLGSLIKVLSDEFKQELADLLTLPSDTAWLDSKEFGMVESLLEWSDGAALKKLSAKLPSYKAITESIVSQLKQYTFSLPAYRSAQIKQADQFTVAFSKESIYQGEIAKEIEEQTRLLLGVLKEERELDGPSEHLNERVAAWLKALLLDVSTDSAQKIAYVLKAQEAELRYGLMQSELVDKIPLVLLSDKKNCQAAIAVQFSQLITGYIIEQMNRVQATNSHEKQRPNNYRYLAEVYRFIEAVIFPDIHASYADDTLRTSAELKMLEIPELKNAVINPLGLINAIADAFSSPVERSDARILMGAAFNHQVYESIRKENAVLSHIINECVITLNPLGHQLTALYILRRIMPDQEFEKIKDVFFSQLPLNNDGLLVGMTALQLSKLF